MLDLRFEKVVYGGDALAHAPDGRTLFAPFIAPGELARVEVTEEKKGFLRARLVEILEPSPARVAPRCQHFGECGGCHLQHLSYDQQLRSKEEMLREQMTRIGGVANLPMEPAIASPMPYQYRNHIQFSLAAGGGLGFNRLGSTRTLKVEECWLPEQPIVDLWKSLDFEPFPGLRQVGFRASDGGEMIVFESDTGEPPETTIESEISAAILMPDGDSAYLAGGPLHYQIFHRGFQVSPGSFFQVNTGCIPKMVEAVLRLGKPARKETALDLYCGAGLFSAFLAEKCEGVIGAESSPSAVEDYQANLEDFDSVALYAASTEEAIGAIEAKIGLAVVDPPRTGMTRNAMKGLLKLAPNRLVMVSCDPATLARDARELAKGGYRLQTIVPIDNFPQTYHLETVSLWIKE